MRRLAIFCFIGVLAGCGAAKIDRGDANVLKAERDDLKDAVRTEKKLAEPGTRRRLVKEVGRRLGIPLLELKTGDPKLDKAAQVGAATGAIKSIEEVAPSLVVGRSDRGGVIGLDEDAIRDFSRYALSDPKRALHRPAADSVRTIISTMHHAKAEADSKISTLGNQTAEGFLTHLEAEVRPFWPDLASRLAGARAAL